MAFAALALIWTAFAHGAVTAGDWYVSSCLIGCAILLAGIGSPCACELSPLATWVRICLIATGAYLIFQVIPLPLAVLRLIDPPRALLFAAAAHVVPAPAFAPIAVKQPAAILWTSTLFGGAALFFVVRRFAAAFRERPWITLAPLFFLAVVEALIGLSQASGKAKYVTGTYNSRDHYAFLLEIVVPLFAAAGLLSMRYAREEGDFTFRHAAVSCASWCLALVVVAAVFSSLSRAGSAATLAGLAVFGALAFGPSFRSRRTRAALALLLLTALAIALFAFTPSALLERLFETGSGDYANRVSFWRDSVPLLAHFPIFGVGLLGFESTFLHYQSAASIKRVNFAHNDYLQYLIELGAIGFTLLAAAVAGVLWPAVKGALGSPDPRARVWLTGCTASFVAVALHSIVDFNLYVPGNVLAFCWIAAFASATVTVRHSPGADSRR